MVKKQYLFVLGRDSELAKLEIESFLTAKAVYFKIVMDSDFALLVELEEFNVQWVDELGGTVKIAELISNSSKPEIIERELMQKELYLGTSNNITYFIDSFDTELADLVNSILKDYFKSIRVKASLKKESSPSRLIRKNTVSEGIEIVVFRNIIARTIAVSNPFLLKERDLGRPKADYMKTISLRLAKMLVNISMVKPGEILLDPFCGSGGILQEALLKGVNVIGVDSDSSALIESRANIEWVSKEYGVKAHYKLIKGNAADISSKVSYVNGVVTEPYLGPYIKKMPTIFQAKGLISELLMLYSAVLTELNKIVKKSGRVVMIIPIFKTLEGKKVSMNFQDVISKYGFILVHNPIPYGYKENKILREIYVMEKTK